MIFSEDFAYCMAHHLPKFPARHKCRKVHGHTCVLTVRVLVTGPEILDHALLREAIWPIVRMLDHAGVINDLAPSLADGTTEAQLRWFWGFLLVTVPSLGVELVELEHAEASAPGGVFMWHRKTYRGPT